MMHSVFYVSVNGGTSYKSNSRVSTSNGNVWNPGHQNHVGTGLTGKPIYISRKHYALIYKLSDPL